MARLEERIGTIRTPVSTPRIPRWLLYSGIGTAAIVTLVAGYLSLRSLGVPLPPQPKQAEQGQEQQYNPPQNGSEVTQQIPGIENVMSAEQVKATLEEILALGRPLTYADTDIWNKVSEANETIYFMLTGRTLEQDKFVTKILPREQYDSEVGNMAGTAGTIGYGPNGVIYICSWSTNYLSKFNKNFSVTCC